MCKIRTPSLMDTREGVEVPPRVWAFSRYPPRGDIVRLNLPYWSKLFLANAPLFVKTDLMNLLPGIQPQTMAPEGAGRFFGSVSTYSQISRFKIRNPKCSPLTSIAWCHPSSVALPALRAVGPTGPEAALCSLPAAA